MGIRAAFLLCLGLAAVVGKVARFDRPWTTGHEQCSARYSIIARNFTREGLGHPPLLQRTHVGRPPEAARPAPFTLHPPLVPLLVAASFRLSGSWEAEFARAAILPAALASIVVFYLLARRLRGARFAATAALLFVLAPASAFYGAWVETVGWWPMLLELLFLFVFLPWIDPRARPPGTGRALLLGVVFLTAMSADIYCIALAPIALVELSTGAARRRRPAILSLLAFLALSLLLYRAVLRPASGFASVLGRFGTFAGWSWQDAAVLGRNYLGLFGAPLLAAAALGAGAWLVRLARRRITPFDRVVAALILFQAWYTAPYPFASIVHDFCSLYLLPPVALLAAAALLGAFDAVRNRWGTRPAQLAAAPLLLLWGALSTGEVLRRWRSSDDEVPKVQALARLFREGTESDEVAATTLRTELLETVRFYADRMIVGSVLSARSFDLLNVGPLRPAVFLLPWVEGASHPGLRKRLQELGTATELPEGLLYDLRNAPRSPAPDDPPPNTRPDHPPPNTPAPAWVRGMSSGSDIETTWAEVPEPGVIGYRLLIGNEPGAPVPLIDVVRPPFRTRLEARHRLWVSVAAIRPDGSLGPASAEVPIDVDGSVPLRTKLAYLATTGSLLLAVQALVVLRRKGVRNLFRRGKGS